MTEESTHGGKRPGAGRPSDPNAKKVLSLRIPPDVHQFLQQQENTSLFVTNIVRRMKSFREQFPKK